jgi:hypothetical protein
MKSISNNRRAWTVICSAVFVTLIALAKLLVSSSDSPTTEIKAAELSQVSGERHLEAATKDRQRNTQLRKSDQLDDETIEEAVKNYKSTGNPRMLEDLLVSLSRSGKHDRAILIAREATGPGHQRNILISGIFGSSLLSTNEFLSLSFTDYSTEERTSALRAVLQRDLVKDFSYAKIIAYQESQFGNDFEKSLAGELTVSLINLGRNEGSLNVFDRFSRIVAEFPIGSQSEAVVRIMKRQLAATVADEFPFEAWNLYQTVPSKLRDANFDSALIHRMMTRNPEEGFQAILNAEISGSKSVTDAFSVLIEMDFLKATDYAERLRARLKPDQSDGIAGAFISHALTKMDLENAKQWLNGVNSVEVKRALEGKIWSAERDALRKEVGKDPAGTVQSIISGQSEYGDYWLEEAMGTWVTKDFDKAQDWYQQNWNSLPTGKSQYVAAAFATQAIKQGDTATARQWAAHIQDPKTKLRIEAGIAKAEGQAGN